MINFWAGILALSLSITANATLQSVDPSGLSALDPKWAHTLLQRASSVLQLAVLHPELAQRLTQRELEHRMGSSSNGLWRKILAQQLKRCRLADNDLCAFYPEHSIDFSTTFPVTDSSHLISAQHAFGHGSGSATVEDKIPVGVRQKVREVIVVVFDRVGNILYDSQDYSTPTLLDFEVIRQEQWQTQPADYRLAGFDLARLSLVKPLPVKPLELALYSPEVGSDVYLMGYHFQMSGKRELFGGSGQVRSTNDFFKVLKFLPGEQEREFVSTYQIVSDAPAVNGHTGGPLFNKEGRVVSVLSMIFPADEQSKNVLTTFPNLSALLRKFNKSSN